MVTETSSHGELIASPELVCSEVYFRYRAFLLKNTYPIRFTLKINCRRPSLGALFVSVRQASEGNEIELWTSVRSVLFDSEGSDYYVFRKREHRALVRPCNCHDEEHLEEWFKKAVLRIYGVRYRSFDRAAVEFMSSARMWMEETLDGLFQ